MVPRKATDGPHHFSLFSRYMQPFLFLETTFQFFSQGAQKKYLQLSKSGFLVMLL